MVKRTSIESCLCIIFSLLLVSGCATDSAGPEGLEEPAFYVATMGDDNNPGTKESPWRTITKAAQTLAAGETVYIREGTYRERVVPKNSGTGSAKNLNNSSAVAGSGHYITYSAYPAETVTIDGSGIILPDDLNGLFEITGREYIKVSGLRIINAGPNQNNCGILVNQSKNIILENNYTYNTASSGIGVWESSNIDINGNEVELACNDGEQECLTVAVTDTFEISNNRVHNSGPGSIGGEGLDAKDGSRNGKIYNNIVYDINRLGIYLDAWDKHTYNIDVYGNTVYNCRSDGIVAAAENGGLLENINIYNNLIYNNRYTGIVTADWGVSGAAHPMKDIYIINNTIYNNGQGSWGGGIGIFNSETQNLVVRNNICSQNLLFQIMAETPGTGFLTADHNLIHGFRGYSGEFYGSNAVTGNPLFVNPGIDFHLQSGSPAIDRGSSANAPSTDFDGISRPQGSGFDIGAFEKN